MSEIISTVNPYATGLDVTGYSEEELWPRVDIEFEPFGSKVLVQLRRVMLMSGVIALVDSTGETEAWNVQIGKVLSLGPLAFKNRKTAEAWPEGMWCKPGDYVRFPRWGGDRLSIQPDDRGKPVVVMVLDDHHLLGRYTGDPRKVKVFLE